MVLDICATILKPVDDGEYVVLVSAFPAEPARRLEVYPHLSCPVQNLQQARQQRFALVDEMKIDLERRGHSVRQVRMKG